MRGVLPLLLALLLAECSSPPTNFYTLAPVPPAHRIVGSRPIGPIEVAEVAVPATIDRNAIVLSAGDDRLEVSSNDQWAAPLGQLVRQTLTADLQARLPDGSVLPPGGIAPGGGLRILILNIQGFIGGVDGTVVLNTGWELVKAGSTDVLRSGHEVIRVRAASGKAADIVPAMSQAVGALADRIAAAIG